MLLQKLEAKKLIHPPNWLVSNTIFLTIMGSQAYGVSEDSSDFDCYGICIPKRHVIFGHLAGVIKGFGDQGEQFDQWQEHHIYDPDACAGKGREYDFQIFNIVKMFALLMKCNPNVIDSIFTPITCILHSTAVGQMIRDNRHLFLHKGAWTTYKSYSYSQLHKLDIKEPTGKRKEQIEKFGYDPKYAYHIVRLINEVEQILNEGDLDIQRSREQLKSIRRGEWSKEEIRQWFNDREKALNTVCNNSKLPEKPDEKAIKQLLLNCLEHHYGNLADAITTPDKASVAITKIKAIIEEFS